MAVPPELAEDVEAAPVEDADDVDEEVVPAVPVVLADCVALVAPWPVEPEPPDAR